MAHILVVDDDGTICNVVAAVLTKDGHSVLRAADGREALIKIRANPPDLVITDIVMPESDGLELLMTLLREGRKVPVIAMTGVPSELAPYLKIARNLGAVRTLEKPFTMSELIRVTKEALPIQQTPTNGGRS